MKAHGFKEKFTWAPSIKNVPGIERREHYIAKVYDYPESYRDKPMTREGRPAHEHAAGPPDAWASPTGRSLSSPSIPMC